MREKIDFNEQQYHYSNKKNVSFIHKIMTFNLLIHANFINNPFTRNLVTKSI